MKASLRWVAVPVAAVLALSLSACNDKDDDERVTAVSSSQASGGAAGSDALISVKRTNESAVAAIDAALKARPGRVVGMEWEKAPGLWEVDVLDGDRVVTVRVDLAGVVLDSEFKVEPVDADDQAEFSSNAVALRDLIVKFAPEGAVLDDAELDTKLGRLVWELGYDNANGRDAGEVAIDANSGEVVSRM